MPSEEAFDIYTNTEAPATKKKASKRHRGERYLTIGHSWHRNEETEARFDVEIKAVEARYAEEIKAGEAKHVEQAKAVKARVAEELKATEARVVDLIEELRRCQESVVKITAVKEKFKEASEINFKEASKLQDDLVISRKETVELEERTKLLEETNARNLEKFKGATFNSFYLFWKNNPEANFDYLPEQVKKVKIAKCATRLVEEQKAQESPEISLATGTKAVEDDVGTTVDQQSQMDPPTAQ
ncbi:uncharacterized protein LOC133814521 [Humulus lupulus]|uniref:uncharacterized protein LOC133814521 n=1 Tax=Humulus lupulus TaxID=3486 RepID=UPI002B413B88|nr:uncharacterized protein LOC133814521 [Humulus lupulus]